MKQLKHFSLVILLPVSLWAATLSGTIRRNDTTTIVISNAKVIVSNGGLKVDSAITNVSGNYTLTLNAGTYNVSVSAAGFKSDHDFKTKDTTLTVVAGGSTVLNTGLTPALSTIGGTVRTGNGTTGAVVSGAKVILQHRMSNTGAGIVWESVDSTLTDANGIYAFPNQIAASTVATGSYRIVITAAGHQSYPSTNSEILADVYQVGYAATFTISGNIADVFTGTLSGTIRRNDTTTIVIPNAKVVVSNGNTKVDSAITNASGNYTLSLKSGTYNVSISATGFKSDHGLKTKDTTVTIISNANTVFNTGLTPALSTIGGTIRNGNVTTGVPIVGAKVVLQHRMSNNGSGNVWESVDSTITDANGIYAFANQIAAAAVANGSYRIVITAAGYRSYPSTNAEITADVYQVGYGATLTITQFSLVAIQSVHGEIKNDRQFSRLGDQLVLNLNSSNVVRSLEIFDLQGVLQRTISIPGSETRLFIPASLAPEKGYLYGVK